ncbi:hypothetical protein L6164_030636 [Bauhinia variegata]|uniref:Uncharacterized protein n=1 Tax=Bauhinia variegata TaxID=167791 RepID=A0ACB9LDA7_BAUVA|nr:hypothetical protein L6164_030636 [Bauhinia variegata]
MANRFFLVGLRRINFLLGASSLRRLVSSRASPFNAMEEPPVQKEIMRMKSSIENPIPVLQCWVEQGNRLSKSELRRIIKTLIKSKRFHHALERLKNTSRVYPTWLRGKLPVSLFYGDM